MFHCFQFCCISHILPALYALHIAVQKPLYTFEIPHRAVLGGVLSCEKKLSKETTKRAPKLTLLLLILECLLAALPWPPRTLKAKFQRSLTNFHLMDLCAEAQNTWLQQKITNVRQKWSSPNLLFW